MKASRLSRITIVVLLFVTSLSLLPVSARAQDNAPFPPNPLPSSATLNYVVDGEVDPEFAGSGRLVFERFEIEVGDTMPAETGPQILINVAGMLETVDDLGLTASLKAGDRLFAPSGAIDELTAKEKSTILRARFARPVETDPAPVEAMVTIYAARCDPNTIAVPAGSTLEVVNETDQTQPFTIESLDIAVEIEPNSSVRVELPDAEIGTRVAKCGKRKGSESPIGSPALQITEPDPVPTQATTEPEFDGQTILLDAQLDVSEILTTLYVAKVTLQGKSNTGEQSFDGVTGVIAMSQPLSLVRTGRLPATLPVGTGVALPADTEITIENTAVGPTEFFVVGLASGVPTSASSDSESDQGEESERPTSRAASSEEPSPTPVAVVARSGNQADLDNLGTLLPQGTELIGEGFFTLGPEEMTSYSDSLLDNTSGSISPSTWEEGVFATYVLQGSEATIVVTVERFSSNAIATGAVYSAELTFITGGEILDPPHPTSTDQILEGTADLVSDDSSLAMILGRFGDVVVTVAVSDDLYEDVVGVAETLWQLVEDRLG
ncbi:hypothetical protein BH09CHL1_BH09CHL1_10820 [soil metagenome]